MWSGGSCCNHWRSGSRMTLWVNQSKINVTPIKGNNTLQTVRQKSKVFYSATKFRTLIWWSFNRSTNLDSFFNNYRFNYTILKCKFQFLQTTTNIILKQIRRIYSLILFQSNNKTTFSFPTTVQYLIYKLVIYACTRYI